MEATHTIGVIGHTNPDTDSICSAIAYAALKSATCEGSYTPLRAGAINGETAYVLRHFEAQVPDLCTDVSAQVMDIDIRRMPGIDGRTTVRKAWETMRDQEISTLPITDPDGKLQGIIALQDLAMANMDQSGAQFLADSKTPFQNILETLNGTLITGDPEGFVQEGKVVIGAASPEIMEEVVSKGDLVLVANRYESQYCAIEMGASCIIVCTGSAVPKTIVHLAQEHGCAIISTPHDTYPAACKLSQCVPVGHYMLRDNLLCFHTTDSVEDVKEVMGKVRFVYFPVLDSDGKYVGVISRRNLLNLRRKQLILVDHNERTQCVEGWEEAEILEIIDHHRIGNLETSSPVYFRNQPVGCTATVIYQMYQEAAQPVEPQIAGLLLSAILSDTLKFQSPTCTPLDRVTAEKLAAIAGEDVDELAQAMFEAGEALDGKSPEEVFHQDYKTFDHGDLRLGVGQGSFISRGNYDKAQAMIFEFLPQAQPQLGVDMAFYLLTSLQDQSSLVLSAGAGAQSLLCRAFHAEAGENGVLLPGVVSRKKQFIPQLLRALQEDL
jgi:manganese-dependent inorganic pyrophosphatase